MPVEHRPDCKSKLVAPRAASDLAAARERLGVTIEEMAARLRIRVAYLQALEDGQIIELPGGAYPLAFLRSYAQALGLDPDELVRRYKADASCLVGRKPELAFPAPLPQRGLPASAMTMLGLMLLVLAYAAWYKLSADGRLPAETIEPVPARMASLVDQTVAPTTPPTGVASGGPNSEARPRISPAVAAPEMASNLSPSAAAAATPPSKPDPDTNGSQADAGTGTALAIRASTDAWVQVRTQSGLVLLSRIMHAGETWSCTRSIGPFVDHR